MMSRVKSGHLHCNRPCPLYPQERTCAAQQPMSAMGEKRTLRHLLDHLVGTRQQRLRNGEAERLRGLQVDVQFDFSGLLHR
jgi:hypothetical protein